MYPALTRRPQPPFRQYRVLVLHTPATRVDCVDLSSQRVSHQNNYVDRIFSFFFTGPHLPKSKTEFLAVVSKMAILSQNVIFDMW